MTADLLNSKMVHRQAVTVQQQYDNEKSCTVLNRCMLVKYIKKIFFIMFNNFIIIMLKNQKIYSKKIGI